jgi:hypothetical protein
LCLLLQRHLEALAAAAAAAVVVAVAASVQVAAAVAMTAAHTACGRGRWRMRCCSRVSALHGKFGLLSGSWCNSMPALQA